MVGSLFVSDAGQARPGPGYTATYNATLIAINGSGSLNLTLLKGTGEALTVHSFVVSKLLINTSSASMLLNGRPMSLAWTDKDTVWNGNFSLFYIASWGPSAPQNQIKGNITPSLFQGLQPGFYLELRLVPIQPPQTPSI